MEKIYDSIFKTMVTKNPNLLIPLINEMFGTDYEQGTRMVLWSDNHQTEEMVDEGNGEIITDSYIIIKGNNYHIECQSNPDGTIVLRMIEYDFHIALDNALNEGSSILKFPRSAVLYLRHNSKTPDKVKLKVRFPEGEEVDYSVPIIKAKNITKETIIEKKLYFLLPYYIMRIEDDSLINVMADMNEIIVSMEKCYEDGVLTDYDLESVYNHIQRIVNNIYNSSEIKEGVDDIMRGTVYYTHADELLDKGREEGREESLAAFKLYISGVNTVDGLVENGVERAIAERLIESMEG